MCCEADTVARLRALGAKVTPQRLLVMSVLRHSGSHVTAARILAAVREDYPQFDPSTVYRVLALLTEQRLVATIGLDHGRLLYEWLTGPAHHHLVCRVCAQLQTVDATAVAGLATNLYESYAFTAELTHLAIVGVCRACAAAAEPQLRHIDAAAPREAGSRPAEPSMPSRAPRQPL